MRTDVHSPKNLVTEDYEYVFSEVNHIDGVPGWIMRRGDWGLEMARWINGTDRFEEHGQDHRGTHQCHHCGAHINYFAVLRHKPTGDAVVVGETCLGNRFELATADFQRLRKQAQLDRERQRIKSERAAFVEANADLAWLNGDDDDVPEPIRWSEFVYDLRDKFQRYGPLSDAQVEALRNVVAKSNEPKPVEPTWVAAPEGRIEVTGKVLTVKTVEGAYGMTVKTLLQVDVDDDHAWKLWVTVPGAANNVARGDTLTIKATVAQSRDFATGEVKDATFAIGKRPTLVAHEAAEVEA